MDTGDFVADFIEHHRLAGMSRYATYHALDWSDGRSHEEIRREIAAVEAKTDYPWNSVGNAHFDYTRVTVLRHVLLA